MLEKELLHAVDEAASRMKLTRSGMVREALREHLRRLEVRAKKQRDREGYARQPQTRDEWEPWEAQAAWPDE